MTTKITTKKMALTAMLACLAFVLNTFVYFPAMAPFQHFVDVLAAVLIGPWYGFAASLLCGIMRMMSGRTIQAVTGAIFGPVLGGYLFTMTLVILFEIICQMLFGYNVFGSIIGTIDLYLGLFVFNHLGR